MLNNNKANRHTHTQFISNRFHLLVDSVREKKLKIHRQIQKNIDHTERLDPTIPRTSEKTQTSGLFMFILLHSGNRLKFNCAINEQNKEFLLKNNFSFIHINSLFLGNHS